MEPPGLFRGRGDHPKMGKFKRRIYPRDITINIGARPFPPYPTLGVPLPLLGDLFLEIPDRANEGTATRLLHGSISPHTN